jgi:hypothetical protein
MSERGPVPSGGLSCQFQSGLIEEGVNLLLVIARPQPGGRELFGSNVIYCQRWFPYSEERVTNGVEEGVNLLLVIARPQPGGGEFPCLDPRGECGAVNFRVGRRF